MATSDLTQELESNEGLVDATLQGPIRNAILKQLEDSSTDVQTVAVKWCACKCKHVPNSRSRRSQLGCVGQENQSGASRRHH